MDLHGKRYNMRRFCHIMVYIASCVRVIILLFVLLMQLSIYIYIYIYICGTPHKPTLSPKVRYLQCYIYIYMCVCVFHCCSLIFSNVFTGCFWYFSLFFYSNLKIPSSKTRLLRLPIASSSGTLKMASFNLDFSGAPTDPRFVQLQFTDPKLIITYNY